MGRTKKFLMRFSISALVAVATPAFAAALLTGASAAMQSGNTAIGGAIDSTSDNDAAAQPDPAPAQASHAPARLSVLVGNDDAAWQSAHSVHVTFTHTPH